MLQLFRHPGIAVPVIAAGLIGFLTPAGAQDQKGVTLRVKSADGAHEDVKLYSGSYALLIANDQYQHLPPLPAIPAETEAIKTALEGQGFQIFQGKVLRNLKEDEMRTAYESFIDAHGLDEGNRLVFYFSGHGHSRENGQRGYIVPIDAPLPDKDEKEFVRKAISMEEVTTWMKRVESKHAAFFFDSCFSGSVFSQRSLPKKPPELISVLAMQPVREYFTAGSSDEVVPARSVFSRALADALATPVPDTNRDGYVVGLELAIYLRDQVAEFANNKAQFGTIRDRELAAGDLVFETPEEGRIAVRKEVLKIDLPPALAAMKARGGRLRAWGTDDRPDGAKPLDVSAADGLTDLVRIEADPVETSSGVWVAWRKDGTISRPAATLTFDKNTRYRQFNRQLYLDEAGRFGGDIPEGKLGADFAKMFGAVPQGSVVDVARGWYFAALLTRDGRVVAGVGNPTAGGKFTPEILGAINATEHVVEIEGGTYSLILLLADGTVRSFNNDKIPTPPAEAKDIVGIAAGQDFFVALARTGKVIAWGPNNEDGQLNVPALPGRGVKVKAFGHIAAAQMEDGRWIAWGDNKGGVVDRINSLGPVPDIGFTKTGVFWIEPVDAKPSPAPVTATKEKPFENPLGMRFVPVPITGGPTDGKKILFSVWETRVKDYEAFVKVTKRDWPKVDWPQTGDHPAVNVSWEDAAAFCSWLTGEDRKSGKIGPKDVYRLPSDHEWSCAMGIGKDEDPAASPAAKSGKVAGYPWGKDFPPPKGAGNFWGEETKRNPLNDKKPIPGYDDGFERTAPVGSFAANASGLQDLSGNVVEWCENWFDPAVMDRRLLRGGAWGDYESTYLLSSSRGGGTPSDRYGNRGFRVVLEVGSGG